MLFLCKRSVASQKRHWFGIWTVNGHFWCSYGSGTMLWNCEIWKTIRVPLCILCVYWFKAFLIWFYNFMGYYIWWIGSGGAHLCFVLPHFIDNKGISESKDSLTCNNGNSTWWTEHDWLNYKDMSSITLPFLIASHEAIVSVCLYSGRYDLSMRAIWSSVAMGLISGYWYDW